MPADPNGAGYFIKSFERGLAVIRCFSEQTPQRTVSDVADATGITRAAARRFLLTMVDLGYVMTDGRTFTLTPRILDLGFSYLSSLSLPDLVRPFMAQLSDELKEGVSIAVLDGLESVNVGRVEPAGMVRVSVPVGTRLPAYCNSMGRVLLAALPPEELDAYLSRATLNAYTANTVTDPDRLRKILTGVARNGFALINQEMERGLVALAVPLHDSSSKVIAAMNVTTHAYRVDMTAMRKRYLAPLQETAWKCDDALRSRPPFRRMIGRSVLS